MCAHVHARRVNANVNAQVLCVVGVFFVVCMCMPIIVGVFLSMTMIVGGVMSVVVLVSMVMVAVMIMPMIMSVFMVPMTMVFIMRMRVIITGRGM